MYELKEYLKAINQSKKRLMDSEDEAWEKKYPAYIVNKCLAPTGKEECLLVNEMNVMHYLDKKLQFDFLINSFRKRNRFTPWLKSEKVSNIEYVKEYYGYSNDKAKSALDILTRDQIKLIKEKLFKGGTK